MFLGEGLGSVGPGAKVVKRSAYRDQECFRATLTPWPRKPQLCRELGPSLRNFEQRVSCFDRPRELRETRALLSLFSAACGVPHVASLVWSLHPIEQFDLRMA